jgi:hypothetical protein
MEQRRQEGIQWAMNAMLGLNRRDEPPRPASQSSGPPGPAGLRNGWGAPPVEVSAPKRRSEDTIANRSIVEPDEPAGEVPLDFAGVTDSDEDMLDDEPLPPIDFETYRRAKNEQRRQSESPSYGESDFEVIETVDGRPTVKRTLKRNPLSELIEFEKIRKAEEIERRVRQELREDRRRNAAKELFAKVRPTPVKETLRRKSWGEGSQGSLPTKSGRVATVGAWISARFRRRVFGYR